MKFYLSLLLCTIISLTGKSQSLEGAWQAIHADANGNSLKSVVIFAGDFQAVATYEADSGKFINTNGGLYAINGNTVTEKVEFNSSNPEMVGKEISFKIVKTASTIRIVGHDIIFNRIDDGTPGDLNGAWVMSGRVRDGETQTRDTSGPRKTMKILSGTRFQWIAFNTETKQFMGTGGGTYSTIDGKYTEHIKFFSRDDSRVGASLEFNYNIIDGNWHHEGLSSKGDPIHEIWSKRLLEN